jgi:electron transfer flavoprotein alpha subunit
MAKVLLLAEHDGAKVNPSTARSIACARDLPDAEIHVAVFAADGAALAASVAALDGVGKVLQVDDPDHEHPLAALIAPQVAALAKNYTHVFGPSTTFGKDLMPRVAALLGVNQVSDIMQVEGSHRFKRPVYAGNAILTVEAPADLPVVATVRTASYQAVEAGSGAPAPVEKSEASADKPGHTRFVGINAG